jgi:hypothetical protein
MPSHQNRQKYSPELLHAKSPDLTEMFSRTAACQVTRLDRNVLQNCCMPSHRTVKSGDLACGSSGEHFCQVWWLGMQQFWRTFLSSLVTWHAAVLENISVKSGDLACSSSGEHFWFSRTAACQVTRLDRNVLQNCCMPSHQTWQKCSPELLHAKSPDLTEMFSRTAACQVTRLDRNRSIKCLSQSEPKLDSKLL